MNQSASYSSTAYLYTGLIAANSDLLFHEAGTLLSGQNLVRGAVLGRILLAAIAVGTVTFAGTGNGTCTKASPAYSAAAKAGSYSVVCLEKTTDSGTFAVMRPDGTQDGIATVGAAYDGQVKFTIADGSTDFAAGDTFTVPVTIAAGSGKYVLSLAAATDGSQVPAGVLVDDTDASAGDKPMLFYSRGDFLSGGLTLGTGHTVASIAPALKDAGIFLFTEQTGA
jgi:hypothetical protein